MSWFRSFFGKYKILLILFGVILAGFSFRIYRVEDYFGFDHDQDLFSWIVKDIIIEQHPRLIGQLTSIDGVFIGPLFYYLLVPFFALFGMNPLAAYIPVIIIGLFTILSIYYTFNKIFGLSVALIASYLYAVSYPIVMIDRWVVPTQPVFLWSVWFLYCLFSILMGNLKVIPILGLLLGLIWHIHTGLLPLVILIPVVLYLSRKKIEIRQFIYGSSLFLIGFLPYLIFEFRHGFSQTKSLFQTINMSGGIDKTAKLFGAVSGIEMKFFNIFFPYINLPYLVSLFLFLGLLYYVFRKSYINKHQIVVILGWFGILAIGHILSSRPVSQYYFNSLVAVSLIPISFLLKDLYKRTPVLIILFLTFTFINSVLLLASEGLHKFGYRNKKLIAEYIKNDVQKNKYKCISVDYIAPYGTGVGFRYLIWWNNINLIKKTAGIPEYKIAIPIPSTFKGLDKRYGAVGVIKPKGGNYKDWDKCDDKNNKPDKLLGFTS